MIFMRYESFSQYIRLYPATTLLLSANIVMFAIVAMNGGTTDIDTLLRFGAMVNFSPGIETELWRWFTAMFLHGGFQHLLFNCFALFVFAPPLERFLGIGRYALLYVGSGLLGNMLSALYGPDYTVSVGASGAVYGIYGAYVAIIAFRRARLDEASVKTVKIILLMGFVYSFLMANINWLAHLGGVIGGFLIYLLMDSMRRHSV